MQDTSAGTNVWITSLNELSYLEYNEDRRTYNTEHFTVTHRDTPDTFRHYNGNYPEALALYLEDCRSRALNYFELQGDPNQYPIQVTVLNRGIIDTIGGTSGLHSNNNGRAINTIYPKPNFLSEYDPTHPPFYSTAVHEAIGHSIVEDGLLQHKQKSFFLSEGLANLATCLCIGINPHNLFAVLMLQDLGDTIEKGKYIGSTMQGKSGALANTYFRIGGSQVDISLPGVRLRPSSRLREYCRAHSFLQYCIDTFGITKTKEWLTKSHIGNFHRNISAALECSIKDLESGWRDTVLFGSGFSMENPLLKAIKGTNEAILGDYSLILYGVTM